MRTSILAIALAAALLVASGGAFAASDPVRAQQATTTNATTDDGGMTTSTDTTTTAGATAGSTESAITFEDQNSSGETVSIRSATLPRKGFVVINGTPNGTEQVLGASYLLNPGTADNVRVELDQPISDSQSLTAVLYADSNGNGKFDPPSANNGSDKPVYEGDSNSRVVDIAQVSAQSASNGGTGTTGGAATTSNSGTTAATQTASNDASTTAAGNESGGAATEGNGSNANGGSGNESGGSGAGGPGFGPVVAVIALIAVALFARRRS